MSDKLQFVDYHEIHKMDNTRFQGTDQTLGTESIDKLKFVEH
jgi:hypothetical protein